MLAHHAPESIGCVTAMTIAAEHQRRAGQPPGEDGAAGVALGVAPPVADQPDRQHAPQAAAVVDDVDPGRVGVEPERADEQDRLHAEEAATRAAAARARRGACRRSGPSNAGHSASDITAATP